MSGGVLEVMKRTAEAYADLRSKQGRGAVLADDLLEARETVKKLIEALRETQDALLGYDGLVSNPKRADGWSDSDGHQAYMQADAALARANGSDGRNG